MDAIDWWGSGEDLDALQMSLRALAVFGLALALVRISGRRSFGQGSAFDTCVAVLIGAVLSRAIVGASAFWPTIAAGTMLVVLHRLIGVASLRSTWLETLIKGRPIWLVRDGRVDEACLRRALITRADLEEAIRKATGDTRPEAVASAVLERNGEITVVPRGRGGDRGRRG